MRFSDCCIRYGFYDTGIPEDSRIEKMQEFMKIDIRREKNMQKRNL